jgi:protein-S-isoprenylcysteine O-methyltransferase Ste14
VILAGEAVLFQSWGLVILFAVFAAVNAIYFPLFEESGLGRRFGKDYEDYRMHVRRWVPRIRPWRPESGERSESGAREDS